MKKRRMFGALLVLGLLAACASGPIEETQPVGSPPVEVLTEAPSVGTPAEGMPSEEMPSEEAALTGTPAVSETEAVVPPTGSEAQPALVNEITGDSLQLADGSPVPGQAVDLVLDLQKASVAYLVISLNSGEAASGTQDGQGVPIPWELVTIDQVQGLVTLDATLEQLQGAPVMDLSLWPDPSDPQWQATLQSYWGTGGSSAAGY
jgi:hypothetical protein